MAEQPQLKIAYLCDMDPHLTWTYSGGNHRIFTAMNERVGQVTYLDPSWGLAEPIRRLMHRLPVSLNLRLRWRLHYLLAPIIARSVEKQLEAGGFDLVMGVYSLHSMASLRVPKGMIRAFMSDATQSSYRASEIGAGFGSFFKPGRLLDGWVERKETRTLQNNHINLWPSEWQKALADQTYGLSDARSVVVPWGANIEALPADALTYDLDFDQVRLLLVGRDWWAKGGPFVMEVLRGLIDKGIDARLSVVGTTPPTNELENHLDVYPNLDKSISEDARTLEELFKSAHFMVQPSLESYGFAFCEASAFALPSLCMKRGGIPVWDGVNGHVLPVESSPEDFVDVIENYRRNSKAYTALRHSTRSCFDEKLNWAAWGADIKQQLETLVESSASSDP